MFRRVLVVNTFCLLLVIGLVGCGEEAAAPEAEDGDTGPDATLEAGEAEAPEAEETEAVGANAEAARDDEGEAQEADETEEANETEASEAGGESEEAASDDEAEEDVVEVHIEGNDQMQFDTDRFTVEAGQTVRLTLEHTGQMAVAAMGHNVVILEADEDPVDFGNEIMDRGGDMENDFVPEEMRDRVIAFTSMIGGGESDTIEFTAPEEPGEYPFLCSFPGHYAMMNGVMIVEE